MNTMKIYSKKEIKAIMSDIQRLKYPGHKKEKFRQVIYLKAKDDISNAVYLPFVISSYGRVFSMNYHMIAGKVHEMSTCPNKQGYLHLTLHANGTKYASRVHRLVALAFKKNKDYIKRPEVNHKDGVKSNNCIWNIEWVSGVDNVKHAWKHNLTYARRGIEHGSTIYTESQIRHACELLEKNVPYKTVAEVTGVSYHTVINIIYRRQWLSISTDYDFSNNDYYINKMKNKHRFNDYRKWLEKYKSRKRK